MMPWLLLLWLGASASEPGNQTQIVQTTYGPVQGIVTKDDIQEFFGIPFAAPPVGDLRFRAPRAPQPWTSVRQCDKPAPVCPQFPIGRKEHMGSEDCLYLDVYVPGTPKVLLPVMVWIYGGGYTFGDGFEFGVYNAKYLMKHDVIIVTFNYRLGALGFMALDELRDEDEHKSTGNYAILDQLQALHWVQDNIKNFGGDPTKVTIFGESAGAFSTCAHLASPLSKGLFRAAIMESGTCDSSMFFASYKDATSFSTLFSSFQGCQPPNLAECLRKVPVQNLINITFDLGNSSAYHPPLWPAMPWGPAIDGVTTPVMPLTALQSGNFNRVPLLIGTNHDEGTVFIPGLSQLVPGVKLPLKTQAQLHTVLLHFFNNSDALKVEQQYPVSRAQDYDGLMALILRDYFFICSSRRAAAALANHSLPVYYYQFDYRGDLIWNTTFGDFHASELLMVFDNYQVLHYSPRDIELSTNFQDYWTNFAKTLNPNTGSEFPDLLNWPEYDSIDETNIVLDLPLSLNKHLIANDCAFWDQLLYPA